MQQKTMSEDADACVAHGNAPLHIQTFPSVSQNTDNDSWSNVHQQRRHLRPIEYIIHVVSYQRHRLLYVGK